MFGVNVRNRGFFRYLTDTLIGSYEHIFAVLKYLQLAEKLPGSCAAVC